MLTRAAREQNRRNLRQYLLNAEYSKLTLPWTSPTTYTQRHHRHHVSSHSPAPRPATTRPLRSQNTSRQPSKARQLATAIDSYRHVYPDTIPFDGFGPPKDVSSASQASHHEARRQDLATIRSYDTADTMIIRNEADPVRMHFVGSHKTALTAELSDLQQNLYACVQVGRLERAGIIARRITAIYAPTMPAVQDAHKRYLSGCLEHLLRGPSQDKLMHMQKWLEIEVRTQGVPIDHGIIAIMLKATLATLIGSRLDRTIRRYAKFAQDLSPDTFETTLSSSLFTTHEINKILRVLPNEFEAPSEELSEEEIAEIDRASREAQETQRAGRNAGILDSRPIPELRPVEQKGMGLSALKRSLGSLDPAYLDEEQYADDFHGRMQRQIRLEQDVAESALERWRLENENFEQTRSQGRVQQASLGSQVHTWVEEMVPKLKTELANAENPEITHTNDEEYDIVVAAPFLKLMSAEKVAAIAVLQFFGGVMDPALHTTNRPDRVLVVRLAERMGLALLREAQIEKIQTHHLQNLSNLPSNERHKRLSRLLKGKKWTPRNVEAEYAKLVEASDETPWEQNHAMSIKIGAVLLGMMLKTAKLSAYRSDAETGKRTLQTEPVGTYIQEWRKGKKVGAVQVSEQLLQTLKKEPVASLVAKHLPMIVPPKPWKNLREGGYMTTPVSVMRFSDFQTNQKAYVKLAHQRGDMDKVYAGLDVISKTPWRVNKELLAVMAEVWNSGEKLGKLVPENIDVQMPPRPDTDDPKIIQRWQRVVNDIRNSIASNHSQRCYQNFQLEVARAFSNTTFYCPQNADYRGRAYPIPPYFNHTGADHVRALFNFAEGKVLGSEGLFWLKVQLANAFGYDKASLSDRAKFVDDNLKQIFDSAVNPLKGDRWWLKASDPWQTLAACLDVKRALDLPDPTQHVSHLPIQQDGSCNGLQHYAALGGDEIGARQVNLAPGDKPADVYTAVMEVVKDLIHKDAEAGDPRAQALDGHITRKMVKQPVMTNVYGVTYHGATQQVAKQIKEILPQSSKSMDPSTTTLKLGAYVASCIFKALSEMFTGAQGIQIWLGECGARISSAVTPEQIARIKARRDGSSNPEEEARKIYRDTWFKGKGRQVHAPEDTNFKSTIVWTTPLGLPVVQPYRDYKRKHIKTHLQDITILTPSGSDPVNKRKQLQGFPPNFIHSLDATHMMLSALKCDEIGLTFGSVHDSFWTHAADIPTLNRVLRDAFVSMHKEDIVRRLKEEFEARYKGCYQWTSVRRNTPLGERLAKFYKSTLKRRQTQYNKRTVTGGVEIDDLLEEVRRAELLRSEDPAKQEEGRRMTTVASIIEDVKAGDDTVYETDEWGQWIRRENTKSGLDASTSTDLPEDPEDADNDVPEESLWSDADAAEEDAQDVEDAWLDKTEGDAAAQKPKRGRKPRTRTPEEIAEREAAEAKKVRRNRGESEVGEQRRRQMRMERVYFWMPLGFPEPPEKGGFDVTCLRESKYFFS